MKHFTGKIFCSSHYWTLLVSRLLLLRRRRYTLAGIWVGYCLGFTGACVRVSMIKSSGSCRHRHKASLSLCLMIQTRDILSSSADVLGTGSHPLSATVHPSAFNSSPGVVGSSLTCFSLYTPDTQPHYPLLDFRHFATFWTVATSYANQKTRAVYK